MASTSADRLGCQIRLWEARSIPDRPPVVGINNLPVYVKGQNPDHAGVIVLDVGFAEGVFERKDSEARAQIIRAVRLNG